MTKPSGLAEQVEAQDRRGLVRQLRLVEGVEGVRAHDRADGADVIRPAHRIALQLPRQLIAVERRTLVAQGGTAVAELAVARLGRSEEHTSELQSLMRISYAVFCLKKKKKENIKTNTTR